MTAKELVRQALDDLPDDATIDTVIERLYFLHKLQRSLAQADAGEKRPHDEVMRRAAQWSQ
jgi:hypothetical protein